MTLDASRQELISLLQRWKAGDIADPWHVQDDAERMQEKLIEEGLLSIGKEKEGVAAQVDSILGQLTNAQAQFVLPRDTDVMLLLLSVCEDEVSAALSKHDHYWNSLDYDSRAAEVRAYWFGE